MVRELLLLIRLYPLWGLNPFYSPSLDAFANTIEPLGQALADGIRQGIEQGGEPDLTRFFEAREMGLFPTVDELHDRMMEMIEDA